MTDASLPVTGNTSLTQPENRAFYPALDGLRAVAFLMVFFQHYQAMPWGWTGVDLFFVLSGFLITGILFDTRLDPHRARTFYIRRTLRIFPLYYGLMLLLLLVDPIVRWDIHWSWLAWPAYLGNFCRFLHPYTLRSPLEHLANFQPTGTAPHFRYTLFLGHFWSLCVEEQFYLLWPWVVFWIRDRRTLLWICAATLPLCLAARLLGDHLLPGWMLTNEALYRLLPFRLDALLLGGLLALLLRGPHAARLLLWARRALPVALALVLAWFLLTPARNVFTEPYPYPAWHFTWGLTAVDLLAALLLLAALQPGTVTFRVLHLRPLRWLGRLSYGAYVLHDIPHMIYGFIIFKTIRTHIPPAAYPGAVTVLALVCTILLAWLSFRFYETPFLNLKSRWAPSRGA